MPPRVADILMAAGARARTPLELAQWPRHLPYPCKTFTDLARCLRTTPVRIKRAIKGMGIQDENEYFRHWRPVGRPTKAYDITLEGLHMATRKVWLNRTKHLSMVAKAADLTERLNLHDFQHWDLRKFYHGHNITQQKLAHRLGAPELKSWPVQMRALDLLRQQIDAPQKKNQVMLICDESIFSARAYARRYFAPAQEAHQATCKFLNVPTVACLGFIDAAEGKVEFMYRERSINSSDFVFALEKVRAKYGKRRRINIFLDNCRVHRSVMVKEWLLRVGKNVHFVFNLAYRPDLVGIEGFWGHCKRDYRLRIDHHKTYGTKFDHFELVKNVVENIPDLKAMRCALHGWVAVANARPIQPTDFEMAPPVPEDEFYHPQDYLEEYQEPERLDSDAEL